jgi:phosphomannomutase
MQIIIKETPKDATEFAYKELEKIIQKKPSATIITPTGATPILLYKKIAEEHSKGKISFSKTTFIQLDELLGAEKKETYKHYLQENLFSKTNFKKENIHLIEPEKYGEKKASAEHEKIASKKTIDLAILGIGTNGHIGFNEPGSKKNSKTRKIKLSEKSMGQHYIQYGKKFPEAITLGMKTIMKAKKIIALAFGKEKSEAVFAAKEKKNYKEWPISVLNQHKNAELIIDKEAASLFAEQKSGNAFRDNDIRGIYPEEINEKFAENLGKAIVKTLKAKKVIVGTDSRESSKKLYNAIIKGTTNAGANTLCMGLTITPALYFAAREKKAAGIMITASHNPKQYNGFKITHTNGITIGKENGLTEIKKEFDKISEEGKQKSKKEKTDFKGKKTKAIKKGKKLSANYFEEYKKDALSYLEKNKIKKIVAATGNSEAGNFLKKILAGKKTQVIVLNPEKGTIGNPLTENNRQLAEKIIEEKADFGVAFDFDGDRIFFYDEQGKKLNNNIIASAIAKYLLEKEKGTILYDARSDWIIKKTIEQNGGKAKMVRVGHTLVKEKMEEEKALYCGEISGHNYFKTNHYADSSIIAVMSIMSILSKENKKLSTLAEEFTENIVSEEMNFALKNPLEKIKQIEQILPKGNKNTLDGLRIDYPNWWFSLRPSRNEPLLRLNIGAKTKGLLEEKIAELRESIEKN